MKFDVADSTSHDLITTLWSETLASAYQKMKFLDIRHLPVIDDGGRLVGILSDRDAQRAMIIPEKSIANLLPKAEFPDEAIVSDFMTSPVVSIVSSDPLSKAAHLMIDEKISAVVVVEAKRMVGIITSEDLLRVLVMILEDKSNPVSRFVGRVGLETPIGNVSHLLAQAGI